MEPAAAGMGTPQAASIASLLSSFAAASQGTHARHGAPTAAGVGHTGYVASPAHVGTAYASGASPAALSFHAAATPASVQRLGEAPAHLPGGHARADDLVRQYLVAQRGTGPPPPRPPTPVDKAAAMRRAKARYDRQQREIEAELRRKRGGRGGSGSGASSASDEEPLDIAEAALHAARQAHLTDELDDARTEAALRMSRVVAASAQAQAAALSATARGRTPLRSDLRASRSAAAAEDGHSLALADARRIAATARTQAAAMERLAGRLPDADGGGAAAGDRGAGERKGAGCADDDDYDLEAAKDAERLDALRQARAVAAAMSAQADDMATQAEDAKKTAERLAQLEAENRAREAENRAREARARGAAPRGARQRRPSKVKQFLSRFSRAASSSKMDAAGNDYSDSGGIHGAPAEYSGPSSPESHRARAERAAAARFRAAEPAAPVETAETRLQRQRHEDLRRQAWAMAEQAEQMKAASMLAARRKEEAAARAAEQQRRDAEARVARAQAERDARVAAQRAQHERMLQQRRAGSARPPARRAARPYGSAYGPPVHYNQPPRGRAQPPHAGRGRGTPASDGSRSRRGSFFGFGRRREAEAPRASPAVPPPGARGAPYGRGPVRGGAPPRGYY